MKALLIDPDPKRGSLLAQALAASGADVSLASSASFALTMLEWNKQDVIVSRARLGDMEGHELCAIVRSDPSTKDVCFVLVVGPGESAPSQTSAAGVDLLLPDALSTTTLVTRVVQLVRRAHEATAVEASPSLIVPPPLVAPPSKPARPRVITSTPLAPPPAPAPPLITAPRPPQRIASPPPLSVPPVVSPAPAAAVPAMAGLDAVGTTSGARTFQGALGVLEIEELTQAIAIGGKTGRLLLVLNTGGGLIVFEGGRVIHAEYGGQAGDTAFTALVAASHREGAGKFCFIPVHPNELLGQPKTIVRSVEQLLLDAATAMDEERRA
jgi:CheY-like chemotaxis protein